jgi:hypothetical protein
MAREIRPKLKSLGGTVARPGAETIEALRNGVCESNFEVGCALARTLREARLRTVILVAVLSALAIPARAQSMQVYDKTGYLGEYELSGTVSEQPNGRKEYSRPLVAKHVGLCTHDGPKETAGQIRLRLMGSSSRATATLVFEGVECTYEGVLSESYHGFMNCADKTSLPLRLWAKRAK